MRRFALAAVVVSLVAGCQESPTRPGGKSGATASAAKTMERQSRAAAGDQADEILVGDPIRYANLTVFPVLSKTARMHDRFITLDEALKAKTVEIFETGAAPSGSEERAAASRPTDDGISDAEQSPAANEPNADAEVQGDVNRLLVWNRSEKPLYLMPGEIILGGKQDRAIARESILAAGQEPVPIEVFCVEQGRWHGRAPEETAALAGALDTDAADLRAVGEQAAAGEFVASPGNLGKATRLALQEERDQEKVWTSADLMCIATSTITPSRAYSANYTDEELAEKLEPYRTHLQQAVLDQQRVVGVIVAVNGNVEAADVFESTPLFRKLWPKLLKSYALDAFVSAGEENADKLCDLADAREFLDRARTASVEASEAEGGLVLTTRKAEGVASFAAEEVSGGMGGGGFGGAVHASAFSK